VQRALKFCPRRIVNGIKHNLMTEIRSAWCGAAAKQCYLASATGASVLLGIGHVHAASAQAL
jgi:hypothetical protein